MLKLANLKKFLGQHWLAIMLVAVGSWLRITQLPDKGILFGDSGRDLLVAAQAVQTNQLPLLGIPSSVPRFKQGPLTIWLSMGVYSLFGFQPQVYYWVFGLIGCLSLIAIYETSILVLDRKTGLIALALLATSPLAIAHSRMLYHTGPIALTTILALLALVQVFNHKKWSLGLAVLAVSLVFQHELSLFPLFLAIPICWWWGGIAKNQTWLTATKVKLREIYFALAALGVGLWPQILSEIRDNSHQLSGFGLWLGFRVLSFFLPSSQHFGASTFWTGLSTILTYWQRVFVVPEGQLTAGLVLGLFGLALFGWLKQLKSFEQLKNLSAGKSVVLIAVSLITLGYLMHGAPSEAYFPVYTALWPLFVAIGISGLDRLLKLFSLSWLAGIFVVAIIGIYQANFWVDQASAWSYGPSVAAQLNSLNWSTQITGKTAFSLTSPDSEAQFDHYLDNYIWLGKGLGLDVTSAAGSRITKTASDITIIQIKPNLKTGTYFTGFHSTGQTIKFGRLFIQPVSLTKSN